uniref:Uncharacterized protein n=1 Tax=Tanacetum cinerariifolium TaxID=118510 RepID=A0A699HWJ3_TANCI|nr:hypothetical protein [Tanacetum cinerariifolium]
MRELVVKYKAEKVCHEEMVKMSLVDLKVLEVDQCTNDFHGRNESGDVRTLIMEEAQAMKYYVHLRVKEVGRLFYRLRFGESKMIEFEMEQETTKVVVIKEAKDRQES